MRIVFSFLAVFFLVGLVYGQEATPEAEETLRLRPFTLAIGEVSGAAPTLWDELQAGAYIRDDGDVDNTYILHVSAEGVEVSDLLDPFLASYGLESLPESSESYESALLEWTLYSFDFTPVDETLRVDMALAETENRAYIVILQSYPEENAQLREEAFFPALDYFGMPLADIYTALGYEALTSVDLSSFGLTSAYPTSWQVVNEGSYMRGEAEDDFTTLLIQSSPDLAAEDFAQLLLERLNLPLELPDEGEIFASSALDWTVYQLDFTQGVELSMLIALTEDEQRSYMVVLLTLAEEAESLRASVLMPVLDATSPVS